MKEQDFILKKVRAHKAPTWYQNAKLGIFIHWGIYSVPAYAPKTWELGEIAPDETWFYNNPYAEWYQNSIRLKKGTSFEHHKATYGEMPYEGFIPLWQAENWNPDKWAKLFKQVHARYVVLTTKHHDGFCLWNSNYTEFNTYKQGPKRDIVAELTQAVRNNDMKMGLYYSGILDWKWSKTPITSDDMMRLTGDVSYAYADYAYNQVKELIDTYKPSVLWNDIGWPFLGEAQLPHLLNYYYMNVEDGVINDRWNDLHHDYLCKEYRAGDIGDGEPWEMTRGLGLSFGFNMNDREVLSPKNFADLFVSTVLKGGNLLINIGPKSDGSIPEEQEKALKTLGEWIDKNGEGIFDSNVEKHSYREQPDGTIYAVLKHMGKRYLYIANIPNSAKEIKVPFKKLKPLTDRKVTLQEDPIGTSIKIEDSLPIGFLLG